MVWADGGCINHDGERVAGSGVFYGCGNVRNAAFGLTGPQTAARAELAALTYVLEHDERSITLRSDCMYVVTGYNDRMHQHRARAWMRRPLRAEPIPHQDLPGYGEERTGRAAAATSLASPRT